MASLQIISLIILIEIVISAKFPSTFQKCDFKSPNFDKCIVEAVQNAVKQLDKPIKEVGLPSLNPFEIPKFSIGAGSGPVAVQQNFQNVKVYGLVDVKITNFVFNFDQKYFNISAFIPELKLVANYELNGKVLLLPIQGQGDAVLSLQKLKASGFFPFEYITKRGTKYVNFKTDSFQVKFHEIEIIKMHFDNLFNGNKELGDNINKLLNENWQDIFKDVQAGYENFVGQIALNVANRFFSKVPIVEVFDNFDTNL